MKKWLHFLWILRRFPEQPSWRALLDDFFSILRDLVHWFALQRSHEGVKHLQLMGLWVHLSMVHFWKYLTFVKRIYFFITISGVANSTKSDIGFSNEFGCPHEYLWCHDTPRIYLSQIIIGMIFLSIGYPFVMVVSTTLYSKILGPNPQVN